MNKKYLRLPQIIGYGSGDLGSNAFYTFVTAFLMMYCTDYMGLNAGIIGTLIMVAKCIDGVTDVIFGRIMDNTHSRMGKARPWMLGSSFLLAVCEILMFSIPESIGSTMQYVYFFIVYVIANAIAYTANNIAYAALTALTTRNVSEQVMMGTFRYVFATIGAVGVSTFSISLVNAFGGGLVGWRVTAIIMAVIQVVFCLIAVLSVKELTDEASEKDGVKTEGNVQKLSLLKTLGYLFTNKYYLLILATYIMLLLAYAAPSTAGIYYCKYILGSEDYLGLFSIAGMFLMVGLALNPLLVKKFGIYKVNYISYIFVIIFSVVLIPLGYKGIVMPVIVLMAVRYIFQGPLEGSINTIIAEVSRYIKLTTGQSMEGSMYSCSSIGMKVGSGIGTAMCGWMLNVSGYINGAAQQPASAINMISALVFVVPTVLAVLMLICLFKMDVSKKNEEVEAKLEK